MLVWELMAMLEKMNRGRASSSCAARSGHSSMTSLTSSSASTSSATTARDDVLLLEGERVGFGPELAWADAANRSAGAPRG